ncbi:phage holin family protein [Neobacillus sp. MM2021_6]|uniref:phage holin family protein n=1 Tax=Bacillaceae TaxID=186817 RepID=UPI001409780F|nr:MULTISPECIES: phage holin family protein [Bacillaceae]MBO0961635.1 phage holin family protein [Neobacillus sp. MM2021_6]NHC19450.1 phage holin family protein [Bacillus sp. MM2020_4]
MFGNVTEVFTKMVSNKSLALGTLTGTVGAFFDAVLQAKGFNKLHIYIAAALAIIVVLDYVVGDRLAKKNDLYKSNIGIDACIRDGIIFGIVGVGWIFDQLLGTGALVFAVLAFSFIYHNLQSFVSNLYVLGWDKYFPMWLFKILESEINAKIKKYSDQGVGK